jgi:hypothetical protein
MERSARSLLSARLEMESRKRLSKLVPLSDSCELASRALLEAPLRNEARNIRKRAKTRSEQKK